MHHKLTTNRKPGHTAKKNRTTPQQVRLRYVHGETLFTMSVIAAVVGVGLFFMSTGVAGGLELVIGGTSYFAGHRLGGHK